MGRAGSAGELMVWRVGKSGAYVARRAASRNRRAAIALASASGNQLVEAKFRRATDVSGQNNNATIELRLANSAQLFNTLDPFPFSEGDISADAERYIVEWAQDLPKDAPLVITIHLQAPETAGPPGPDLATAVTGWFAAKARSEGQALREHFRDGRRAFLIGFAGLALCLAISFALTKRFDSPFARIVQESLVIIGWVVIWRPAEMFLYDWLPLLRRKRLYRRLAEARVTVRIMAGD
jgi:hypothetical protein